MSNEDMSNNEDMNKDEIATVSTEFDATEINYDMAVAGPLYIDDRHKKPGYVYALPTTDAGNIEMYTRWGYHIVQDDSISIGDDVASKTSRFGSAVTVKSKCGRLHVLMATTQENFDKLQKHRETQNKLRAEALGKIDGVPEEYQIFNGQPLGEYRITRK